MRTTSPATTTRPGSTGTKMRKSGGLALEDMRRSGLHYLSLKTFCFYFLMLKVELTCAARGGRPPPTVYWTINGKNGEIIDESDDHDFFNVRNSIQVR